MDSFAKRGTEATSCQPNDVKAKFSSLLVSCECSFKIPQIFSRRVLENRNVTAFYQQEEGRLVLEKHFECLQFFSKACFHLSNGQFGKKVWGVVCNLVTPKNLFYGKSHFSLTEVYTIRGLLAVVALV